MEWNSLGSSINAVVMQRATPPHLDGPIIAAMPVFNEEETIGSVGLSCTPHVDTVLCVDDNLQTRPLESQEN